MIELALGIIAITGGLLGVMVGIHVARDAFKSHVMRTEGLFFATAIFLLSSLGFILAGVIVSG